MTLAEIKQAHQRGDYGKTDWKRVEALTDEEIEEAVRGDPDAAPLLDQDFWKRAKIVKPRNKVDIHMRLDPDIVEFFKKEGPGYQSRINAVLRSYVEACKGNRV
ncbi:MAG: BrnA antitoxin family protein [bacterium]